MCSPSSVDWHNWVGSWPWYWTFKSSLEDSNAQPRLRTTGVEAKCLWYIFSLWRAPWNTKSCSDFQTKMCLLPGYIWKFLQEALLFRVTGGVTGFHIGNQGCKQFPQQGRVIVPHSWPTDSEIAKSCFYHYFPLLYFLPSSLYFFLTSFIPRFSFLLK